jgi:hypothetical protein
MVEKQDANRGRRNLLRPMHNFQSSHGLLAGKSYRRSSGNLTLSGHDPELLPNKAKKLVSLFGA